MKLLTYIAAVGLTFSAAGSAVAGDGWITDLEKAKEAAKAGDKKIL